MHVLSVIVSVGWIIFWLYWIVSAFGSKKEAAPNLRQFVSLRVGIIVLAALGALLFNWLPNSLKDDYLRIAHSDAGLALGFILFLLGFCCAVWARIYLGKNWGMPMTQKQSPELITTGPYQYVRHPIYTGILFMALGSFLDVNMYWLLVFAVAAVFFVYSALAEERLMIKLFPKVYPAYKAKTKLLLPFIL